MYRITDSTIQAALNRHYGYEREIVRAAQDAGYTRIDADNNTITAVDPDGRYVMIATN